MIFSWLGSGVGVGKWFIDNWFDFNVRLVAWCGRAYSIRTVPRTHALSAYRWAYTCPRVCTKTQVLCFLCFLIWWSEPPEDGSHQGLQHKMFPLWHRSAPSTWPSTFLYKCTALSRGHVLAFHSPWSFGRKRKRNLLCFLTWTLLSVR